MSTNPTIQFKRKTSASGAPGTLLSGEPAFNTFDNFLYVGNTSAVKWVGAEILNSGTTAFTSDTTLATRKAIGDNFLLQTSTTSLTLNSGAQLRFTETGGGTDYIALKAPSAVSTGNVIYTLPGAYPGSSGYVLQADTSGNLSWSAPSSSANVSITATSASSSYNLIFTDASATNTSASLWMDTGQNIQYNPNTDLLTLGGDIAVNGGDITSTATTFNLLNTTVTGLNLGGAAATINLGATATGMQMTLGGAMNIVTDAASNTSSIGNVTNVSSYSRTASYPYLQLSGSQSASASSGDSAFVRIQGSGSGIGQPNYVYMLPNTSVTGNVEIGGAISGNVLKIRGTAGGVTNLIGDVTTGTVNLFNGVTTGLVNIANGGASTIEIGGTLRSAQTTVNVFNTTTTGINAFGVADTIVMGSANGTATIRNAGVNINGTLTVTGNSTFQSNILANGGTITSTATTFNLLNTTVTNANVLGAANTINLGSSVATINLGTGTTGANVYVKGNLFVQGATTTISSTTVSIADLNVVLADGQSTTAGVNGAGITLGSTGITWQYNNTGNNWESTENINIASGKTFKINNSTVLSSSALGSSITSASGLVQVGTIGLGTWQGTTIGVAYGGTGLTTYTTGAIVYATAATTLANLAPVSTSGAVLSSTGLNSNPEYKTITLSYGTVTSASNSLSLTIQNAAADGTTKGVATFNSTQFDDASGVITLDTIDGGTYA